jgi:hypothetical protein
VGIDQFRGGNIYVFGNGSSGLSGNDITGMVYTRGLQQSSDQKFKSNIVPLTSTMSDYLHRINPQSYVSASEEEVEKIREERRRAKRTANGGMRTASATDAVEDDEEFGRDWGFLAQDVQEVFPHLVHFVAPMGGLTLNYTGFVPILWKIAQEQQAKLEEQQARIEKLEEQIAAILQKLEE